LQNEATQVGLNINEGNKDELIEGADIVRLFKAEKLIRLGHI
jgi:hypothetical protein